jgi:hypothetical protein
MAALTVNVLAPVASSRPAQAQRPRAASQPARLVSFSGLSKHQLGGFTGQTLSATVEARVAAPVSRGQRVVVSMAKKSVGDLTKADLDGKVVLVCLLTRSLERYLPPNALLS